MNTKTLVIGIVVVVLLLVGGVFLLGRRGTGTTTSTTPNTMNAAPTSSATSQPSATAPTTAAANAVTIQNYAFSPSTITVKVGDSVTWTNQDSTAHTATADDGSFDTGVLSQGASKTVTFSKAGTFPYHCSMHPYMKGTVVVQ